LNSSDAAIITRELANCKKHAAFPLPFEQAENHRVWEAALQAETREILDIWRSRCILRDMKVTKKHSQLPRRGGLWVTATLALLINLALPRIASAQVGKPGQTAPAWALKSVEGKQLKSADYLGKVVILDFWATWCPPCRAEIPSFIQLQKQYGKDGLVVVGISLDQDGPAVVKKFIASNGINYDIVMGDTKTTEAYGGVESIPTTFVIDRQGKIAAKHVGLTEKAEFEKEIKPLLKPGT
jgi:peroxiredoxin